LCPRGQYQPEPLQESCLLCPENTTTSYRGATNDSECQRKYIQNQPLWSCVLLFTKDVHWILKLLSCCCCYHCVYDLICSLLNVHLTVFCPDGYQVVFNTSCQVCPRGTYKDNRGGVFGTCKDCPEGKTTLYEGSTSKRECYKGISYYLLQYIPKQICTIIS